MDTHRFQQISDQNIEELKSMLFCFSLEMERIKVNTTAERQFFEERLQHLQQQLALAIQERDEAKEKLLKLQRWYANLQQQNPNTDSKPTNLKVEIEPSIPLQLNAKTMSPLVEHLRSDWIDSYSTLERMEPGKLTDAVPNLSSYQSFPTKSELIQQQSDDETVWPPGNAFVEDPLPIESSENLNQTSQQPELLPDSDPMMLVTPLPEKGKLLDAVMKAGPLLETLLMAGPLPQWQRPPPALDPLEISKISMPLFNPQAPQSPANDSQASSSHHSPSPPPTHTAHNGTLHMDFPSSGAKSQCGASKQLF